MRTAEIYVFDKFAGNLVEDDYGTFTFQYDAAQERAVCVDFSFPFF